MLLSPIQGKSHILTVNTRDLNQSTDSTLFNRKKEWAVVWGKFIQEDIMLSFCWDVITTT